MSITDDYMREMVTRSREYSVVLLRAAPGRKEDRASPIVWEHARRNFELRAEGLLAIVCPIVDGSDWSGVGIFNASVDRTREIMEGDPGVQEGIFTYEVHACRGFPGDVLPA
jgi:hypothetical protein